MLVVIRLNFAKPRTAKLMDFTSVFHTFQVRQRKTSLCWWVLCAVTGVMYDGIISIITQMDPGLGANIWRNTFPG